jgi:hypothetical protein
MGVGVVNDIFAGGNRATVFVVMTPTKAEELRKDPQV